MKVLPFGLLLPTLICAAAELKDVKAVYLYPMLGGLDQHLADCLTQDRVFRVVTDPKLADAVFTDQLGKQFEYRLDHIKRDPAPIPAAPLASAAPPQSPSGQITASMAGSLETEPHGSSFARGKGTVFLVDAKSRQVVWSSYRQPKNASSRELQRTAKRLTTNIADALAPPPPETK